MTSWQRAAPACEGHGSDRDGHRQQWRAIVMASWVGPLEGSSTVAMVCVGHDSDGMCEAQWQQRET